VRTAQARYVAHVLGQYLQLPGTLRRVLRQDRRTAQALYRRGVRLDVVHNAFVLAVARRTFRSDASHLEPIRCLQYFVPVVDELLTEPPLPEYLDYLKNRLVNAGVLPSP
jgi:hypothetical protein